MNTSDYNSEGDTLKPKVSAVTKDSKNEKLETTNFKVKMTMGTTILTATFENNATTKAFREKLPLTLPMLDLYSRELCYHFHNTLPANEVSTRGYEIGEIIYYPPRRSFVIMYAQNGEHFNMQAMGRVEADVEIFRNVGNVDIVFELAENE